MLRGGGHVWRERELAGVRKELDHIIIVGRYNWEKSR